MKKKWIPCVAAAACAAMVVAGCSSSGGSSSGGSSTPGVTSNQIVFGMPEPLTGPFAFYGKYAVAGVQAVFNQVNAAGGINGRKLKIVTADTQCTSGATAVAAAKKLLDEDGAFELGVTVCPVADVAIAQVVLKGTNLVDLTDDASGGAIPGSAPNPANGDAYLYYFTPNTADQGVDAVAWGQAHLSPTPHQWGVLEDDDLYGTNCGFGIQQFAKAEGLPAPVVVQTTDTATNETTSIAKIRSAGADTLALCTYPGPTIGALSAALAAGWQPNVMLATQAAAQGQTVMPSLPKAAYAKAYGVGEPLTPAIGTPQMAAYLKYFSQYYKGYSVSDAEGSFMGDIIVKYLRAAGKDLTRQSFLNAVYNTPPFTVMGSSVPVQILRGPHTNVISSSIIWTFPGPMTEKIVGVESPPSNVSLPGL